MGRVVFFDAVKNDMYQMCIVHSVSYKKTQCALQCWHPSIFAYILQGYLSLAASLGFSSSN